MNQQLDNQYTKFEADRKNLLESLRSISQEKLNAQPEGKWSVIQNLNHLVLAEYGTINYLKKKILAVDSLKKSGIKSWLGYQLICLYLILPNKVKAPKGVDNPENNETIATVTAKWDKLRAEWYQFLAQIPDNQLEKAIFRHPFGSRLNIYQTVGFCEAHFQRHAKQVRRLLQ
jgi:hypothetical protein